EEARYTDMMSDANGRRPEIGPVLKGRGRQEKKSEIFSKIVWILKIKPVIFAAAKTVAKERTELGGLMWPEAVLAQCFGRKAGG
uniref:hypothetical protein n=1 Tax=Saccharicrinis sp. 156 TaxID=3417574 RepID=UPI003D33EF5D